MPQFVPQPIMPHIFLLLVDFLPETTNSRLKQQIIKILTYSHEMIGAILIYPSLLG